MTTELRLRDLCAINNNIVAECDKMMQYLQIMREKSNSAITFLNSLNTANFLRKYSLTYEYLNKFYIKLLDQNCLFELFFLELEESETATDLLSAFSSVKDLNVDSVFDSRKQKIPEEPMGHPIISTTSLSQHRDEVNAFNERFENIKSKINLVSPPQELSSEESDKSMNVHAKEFEPRSNGTSSSSSRDVVIESSSNSVKSEQSEHFNMSVNVKNSSITYTSEKLQPIVRNEKNKHRINLKTAAEKIKTNTLTEENLAQHSKQANKSIKNQAILKTLPKTESTAINSQSSFKSNTQDTHKSQEEKKDVPENRKDDDKDLLDIKSIIKHVKDKMDAREKKYSVPIPDLRPRVVRTSTVDQKETDSSSSVSSPSENSRKDSTKNTKHCTKDQSNIRKENENFIENIVAKRGPAPKEGDLCCISSVVSPSSFYIHVIRDDNALIDSLSEQIAELSHTLKSFNNKREARKCIKSYCVCYITTYSSWCRVQILSWAMKVEDMLEVRLIDYGLSCKVPLRNIREANQYFFILPIMADKCELAWVRPLNGEEEWSVESIEHFNKLINKTDRLFTISHVEEEGDHLVIDLQDHEIHSIAGLMIADGKAKTDDDESDDSKKWYNDFMKKQILKAQGYTQEELNEAEEDRLEALMNDEDDDDEVADPNLAVSHYKAKDEVEICRIFLAKGHCFKGKNCSFSHAPLNPDGWTTDREAVFYDAFNQLQLPRPGSEITVKIVNIVDLRTFYVVIKNLPDCLNLIGLPVNSIRSLVKLMNDPEEIKSHKPLIVIPAVGEIILVKHENNWQRARVVGMEEFGYKIELEVLLVDFGKIAKFNMKHCRKINEKHLHLPFQVVLCTLCNVSMKDDLTEAEHEMGSDYLEMNVENKKLKAKVMYSANFINVHLFTENGQDLGKELVKAGIVNSCSSFTSVLEHGLLVD